MVRILDFSEKTTIDGVLQTLHGKKKKVDILLKSGKAYSGVIHAVGKQCVILEQSGTKSFFNAVIKNEEIAALEVQVRTK